MQGLKLPKVRTFAELAIGTAIQPSRGRLRTIANGCERLRSVWRTQPQPPNPQWNGNPWNRNPCYAFEKNIENNNTKKKIEQRGPVRIGAALESRMQGTLCRFTYSTLQENRKVNAAQNRGKWFLYFFDNFPMFGVCLGSLGSLYCGPPGLMGKDCKPNWRDFAGPSWRSCGMPWSLDVTCYMSSPWLGASRHPCHSCHSYIKMKYLFSGLLNIPYSERLGPAWFLCQLASPQISATSPATRSCCWVDDRDQSR